MVVLVPNPAASGGQGSCTSGRCGVTLHRWAEGQGPCLDLGRSPRVAQAGRCRRALACPVPTALVLPETAWGSYCPVQDLLWETFCTT